MAEKYYCWGCKVNEIPKPEYCCSSVYMGEVTCGCQGLPIDPPYCEDCFEKETGWKLVEES